jgi:hypothetical protein
MEKNIRKNESTKDKSKRWVCRIMVNNEAKRFYFEKLVEAKTFRKQLKEAIAYQDKKLFKKLWKKS